MKAFEDYTPGESASYRGGAPRTKSKRQSRSSERDLPRSLRAIDVRDDERVELRAGIMTAGDLGYFVGEDGSMKSTLTHLLCAARAGGYQFLGFETEVSHSFIVSEEDSAPVIANRLRAICRGQGWNPDVVLANVHILAKSEVQLSSRAWREHLLKEIRATQSDLVILDPLAEMLTGEENSNSEARPVIQSMRALTRASDDASVNVIAVHHFGKPSDGKRQADLIRGASAFRRASRFTYAIEHDDVAHELKVTCLKLSRGEKLKPFVVRYYITADVDNAVLWHSARFECISVQEATLDKAEQFVRDQLAAGDRMNTTQLKDAAKGTGVSGADISRALKHLEMRRHIDFVEGAKGSKMWGLVCLPSDSGQPGQPEIQLARQPECLPGNGSDAEFCLPSPFRGKQQPAGVAFSATNTTGRDR